MIHRSVAFGNRFGWSFTAHIGATLTTALCIGCANPGPPKPPSLQLPELVKDLSAERSGDRVLLRWTTPSRTNDDAEIKGAMTAEVCREGGAKPLTPAARATACAPVRRLAVAPGASEVSDTLPAALEADPALLLTYRVQIFNSRGRSAGESVAAFAPSGAVPQPVASLRATASEQGAVLEWNSDSGSAAAASGAASETMIDLKRTDLSAPPSAEKQAKPSSAALAPGKRKPTAPAKPHAPKANSNSDSSPNSNPVAIHSDEVHLRAPDSAAHPETQLAGTVDTTVAMGDTYNYVAERVRSVTLSGHALELHSAPATGVTLVMRDIFPPKAPMGLDTVSGVTQPDAANPATASAAYVDLSWEPNEETDLAGYRVYRQLARPDGSPQGPLARLTASPITAPAFRDMAVKAGQDYIYTVTAVDAAGNESAPSAKVLESVQSPR